MSTAPPTYADAVNDIGALNLTPEEKAAAQGAFTEELGKDATTKALLEEVKALSADANKLDQDFYNVGVALGKVDNAGFNFPTKLKPGWDAIRAKWIKLYSDSRRAATRTEAKIESFHKSIIPRIQELLDFSSVTDPDDQMYNVAIARDILRGFLNENSPVRDIVAANEGLGYSVAFQELEREINEYKNSFDNHTQKVKAQLTAQISSVQGQINSISTEIRNCNDAAGRLSRSLGFTIFGTLAVAGISLLAFGIFGPCIAIKALIVGAAIAISKRRSMIQYLERAQALQGQLRQKEAELRDLQSKLKLLQECESLLQSQRTAMGDIASRVGQVAKFWGEMQRNAELVDSHLLEAESQTDFQRILDELQMMKNAYAPLAEGMRIYATQV